MSKKLFVGNLPFIATESEVTDLFNEYGPVHSTIIVKDRETGRSRGFGFVELEDSRAEAAKLELNGANLGGRNVRINEAWERGTKAPRPINAW
ncbi:MAG: RNA recognition motif domain-containing protein [Chitinivibrionales bacterium]